MNFVDFQRFRDKVLSDQPAVLDCAATNLYAALAHLITPARPVSESTVHRCHLAEKWVQHFGFPSETTRRALVSCGVRSSLLILFRYYAGKNARLWLPSDNYPVYGELARNAHLTQVEFATLPEPAWPDALPVQGVELLLITNPLKPLGRWLTRQDTSTLTAWLAGGPQRRLILDTVYTFERQFHPTTLQLLATGQTILLHSLTKGWLHPRLFGVAFVPESDAPDLTSLFRAQPPPQQNLAHAWELLNRHVDMPSAVAREIAAAGESLLSALPAGFPFPTLVDAPGYFSPVSGRWADLLKDTKVLGLPATVFGSSREDITILTSLSFIA